MVLMLFPVTAFAEESGSITIDGADVVCAQQDYEFTVTASEGVTLGTEFGYDTGTKGCGADLTIDADGVGHGVVSAEWYDLQTNSFDVNAHGTDSNSNTVTDTKHVEVSPEHIFVDGVCGCGAKEQYIVQYDGGPEFGLQVDIKTHGVDLTLAGKTFYREGYVQTGWVDEETGRVYKLGATYTENADVTLNPVYDQIITLTVPFTTTVKQGGNTAPGETTFELAIVDVNAGEERYADVTVSGSITTNGAGDYESALTFSGPSRQLWAMLSEGAFVQQVNGGEENWTYDDTVYGLVMSQVAYSTDDAVSGYTVLILPAICEETDDGVRYDIDWEEIDWENGPLDEMRFTNTYTKSTTKPATPETGDNSNFGLWFALLAISAAGIIGTGVYSKFRRSSRAK